VTLIINTKLSLFGNLANFFRRKIKVAHKISPINIVLIGLVYKIHRRKISLISLLMDMRFERGCVSRCGFIIPLTTIWLACGLGNSFWARFYSHNKNNLF